MEALEVAPRVAKTVDVIDADAVERAVGEPLEHEGVRRVERSFVFLPQGDELRNVEKAAIVELVGGAAPKSEAVVLLLEEGVEAHRIAAHLEKEGVHPFPLSPTPPRA